MMDQSLGRQEREENGGDQRQILGSNGGYEGDYG